MSPKEATAMDPTLMKKALKFFGREEVFCAEHLTPHWPYLSVEKRIQHKKQSHKSTHPFVNAEQYFVFEFFEWAWQYLHSYDPQQNEPVAFDYLLLDKPERVSHSLEERRGRLINPLGAFRIVIPIPDDDLRMKFARPFLDKNLDIFANEPNPDLRKLLNNLILAEYVEPLFFLEKFIRIEQIYPIAMEATQRWRKKPYRRFQGINTFALEHKLNAFLQWVRARQTTDSQERQGYAMNALVFFDKLIGRTFHELQRDAFAYRLYSLWLRIEFDLDQEIVMEFLKYFKHLVRGYAPAWEKVKNIVIDAEWKSPTMKKREQEYYTHMRRAAEEVVESSYPDFLPGLLSHDL
jgi:hypothetical protein